MRWCSTSFQWRDRASAQALSFVARRLMGGVGGRGRRVREFGDEPDLTDWCRPRRCHHRGTAKMRPGRVELPRSKRTTRPSTLRATCPIRPNALDPPIWSGWLGELDLVDGRLLSRCCPGRGKRHRPAADVTPHSTRPDGWAPRPESGAETDGIRRLSSRIGRTPGPAGPSPRRLESGGRAAAG